MDAQSKRKKGQISFAPSSFNNSNQPNLIQINPANQNSLNDHNSKVFSQY